MAERRTATRPAEPPARAARPGEESRLTALRRKLPLGLAFGAAVALAVGIAGDAPKVAATLAGFQWQLLPVIAPPLVRELVRGWSA